MLIIKIQNDGTGDVKIGNYRYQILVNSTLIESGEVKGHKRVRGWKNLVSMLLKASANSTRNTLTYFMAMEDK
jgi:hypothetical protein